MVRTGPSITARDFHPFGFQNGFQLRSFLFHAASLCKSLEDQSSIAARTRSVTSAAVAFQSNGMEYRAPGTRDSHGELPTVRRGDDPALEDLLRRLPAGAGGASRAAYRSQASSPSRSGVVIAAERSAAGKGNRLPDISCAKRHPRSDLRQPEPAPLAMGRIEASQSVPPLLVSSLRLTCSSLATLTPGRPGCCVLKRGLLGSCITHGYTYRISPPGSSVSFAGSVHGFHHGDAYGKGRGRRLLASFHQPARRRPTKDTDRSSSSVGQTG